MVANGAPKNGSTWIFQLLKNTGLFSPVPDAYQNPKWQNSSVDDALVVSCAEELAASPTRYTSKQHWTDCNDQLLAHAGIKVCNIIRDIRDVVVSRYHHDVRVVGYSKDLKTFIDEEADIIVKEAAEYHAFWVNSPYSNNETYHITSYEYLSDDDLKAGRELFEFAGLPLGNDEVEAAVANSRFQKKPRRGPKEFFRKGRAFGFVDEIDEAQSDYLLDLASKHQFRRIKEAIAGFNPALGPYLAETDVGL